MEDPAVAFIKQDDRMLASWDFNGNSWCKIVAEESAAWADAVRRFVAFARKKPLRNTDLNVLRATAILRQLQALEDGDQQ